MAFILGSNMLNASSLDGTTNFAHGYPSFSVSIGVLFRGKPAAATVVCLHILVLDQYNLFNTRAIKYQSIMKQLLPVSLTFYPYPLQVEFCGGPMGWSNR